MEDWMLQPDSSGHELTSSVILAGELLELQNIFSHFRIERFGDMRVLGVKVIFIRFWVFGFTYVGFILDGAKLPLVFLMV